MQLRKILNLALPAGSRWTQPIFSLSLQGVVLEESGGMPESEIHNSSIIYMHAKSKYEI